MPPLSRLAVLCLLAATAAQADVFVREDITTEPTPKAYSLCYDHQCTTLVELALTPGEWRAIRRLFQRPPATPAAERAAIARAIALFETYGGRKTPTRNDKGGDLEGLGEEGQMDCIDESINTTTYLHILQREALLRWHVVEDRATRGWFVRGWPHTTAVIRETPSGQRYAVDSWFEDNGMPPHIVPLEIWQDGWEPGR